MFQKKFRKLVYILFILIISQFKSQTYTLDELETITEKYRAEGKIQELIAFNKKALSQYQKQSNKEGAFAARLNISNYLSSQKQNKESLTYLNQAEKDIDHIKSPELRSKFHGTSARNYFELALYEQSLEGFNKSVEYAWKVSDKEKQKKRLYLGYFWKMACFEALKMRDSMMSMERKILKVSPEPLIYITIASRNLDEKKPDSTKYYLDKAMTIVDKSSVYQKGRILFNYGRLYTEKKEYEKALGYYMQALEIFEKMKSKDGQRMTYKLISETYSSLNNNDKSSEFLQKYTIVNDSIISEEKEVTHIHVDKALHQKDQHEKTEKSKLYLLIFGIVAGFLIAGYFIAKTYIKKQKRKNKVIIEKSREADTLKKKLNPAFDEVVHLAQSNDPLFLTRFKEVYADFYEKMSIRYPNLTSNELKFCALLKLNFSSKEIMDYEYISLRTVETRKYRLRKKLNLPSEIDLNKWMMEQ
ncbi:tetratricopeptide repeat protein [Chryseobacterium sp. SIMBA_038]|uniref:tetratricopeptide repeat protein n=2 Tax=Pseudomonadati TaxID=3379134 RepID=UPI003979D157